MVGYIFLLFFLIFGCCGVLASILVMRRFRGEYEGEDERREKEEAMRGVVSNMLM